MDIVLVKVSFLGLEMLMIEGVFSEVSIRYSPVIGILDTDSSTFIFK